MIQGGEESNSSVSRRIVAFKPRQVLLAQQKEKGKLKRTGRTMTKTLVKEEQQQPETKIALLHSVIQYIHDKGFAKTFKRFLKEAQVEDDSWKADSFDLEEMYCKYLDNCRSADTDFKGQKEQEQGADGTMDKDAPVETASKKKKKKSTEENDDAKSVISEVKADEFMKEPIDKKKKKKKNKLTSESLDDNGKQEDSLPKVIEGKPESLEIISANGNKDSSETTKPKDKLKKQKLRMVSLVDDGKGAESAVIRNTDTDTVDVPLDDSKLKLKEKKRKKKDVSDTGVENKGNSQETSDNVANKESKKRKRSASDENKDKPVEGAAIEESKRRKTEGIEEAEVVVKQGEVNSVLGGDGHVGGETEKENGDVSEPQKQFNVNTEGVLKKNGGERSAAQKSARKQRNGSAEPKTVNAFQRVKVDAVEFADERLQDNSYWAKSGAEIGYGAKAQEVLGQVKGRGFRHEKTKKKRGSYRGGQIDLQSHSVKFNYSDNE
ncbi:uncharacterized protein [Coffea arabica]|uniref:Uncharacterized protein isoform X1 n=2 Tax=Coffea arabica TaxID=13443 RepID=A0A6P6WRI4_COFAR|nr:nucleolar and coiled-body phosphoprotein 1-like isoform X2 [Coffea arabica]